MKKIIVFSLALIGNSLFAQNCPVDSIIAEDYIRDAYLFAISEIYSDENHEYKDSVEIPQDLLDKYLGFISSIYTIESEVNDSIFNLYQIHIMSDVAYREILLKVDKNLVWVDNFRQDSLLSGNSVFDSIVEKYDFHFSMIMELSSVNLLYISTSKQLNLHSLLSPLSNMPGVISATATGGFAGGGQDIEFTYDDSLVYFDFSKGWGDCPAGCIYRRYWKFSVSNNCEATYMGSYGDVLNNIENKQMGETFTVYPNPFRQSITLSKSPNNSKVNIYSINGQKVYSHENEFNQIDLSFLKTGVYMLEIVSKNGVQRKKLIKQ